MKKSLLLPLFLSGATVHGGLVFEIGPSYRIDWQTQESHIDNSPIAVPAFHDIDNFNSIGIWEIDGRISSDYCNPFYVGVEAKYGWVTSGNGSNRALFFDSGDEDFINYFNTDRASVSGHTTDLQLFIGYRAYFLNKRFTLVPTAGYEHHQKRFTQNNGRFSLQGSFSGFQRTDNFFHKDHIRGPFVGLDFEWVQSCPFFFFGGFHWNWYLYTSRSSVSYNDSIISDDSFTENYFKASVDAHITGPSAFLGLTYNLSKDAYLCLKSTYYYTYLNNGTKLNSYFRQEISDDTLDSQDFAETAMRVNKLEWESWAIQFMIGYDF